MDAVTIAVRATSTLLGADLSSAAIRCVVPMNSFFQKDPNGKRYAVSRRDGELFGVAGIWENWR